MSVQELIDALLKIEDKSRPVCIETNGDHEYDFMALRSVTKPRKPWVYLGDGDASETDEDGNEVTDSTPGAFYPVLLEDR